MNTDENLELFAASAFCLILLVVLPYIGDAIRAVARSRSVGK